MDAFAKVNKDNSLDLKYDKIFDTTHIALVLLKKIKKKVYEKDIVYAVWSWQLFFGMIVLVYLKVMLI